MAMTVMLFAEYGLEKMVLQHPPSIIFVVVISDVSNPPCSQIKYSTWDDITASDIGISSPLEFTPSFLTRMR